ncbi:hypothetical protein [Bradyrhizobium sp. CB2312]|uniref:hypothetical protein n=1 Tax=Bradyrhizobium sp. CB2312 TaxID=3039155 RepID=UPI0024B0A530|nr:hypothetical protein [Bradyrhizobium sp. CB2312]WFU69243.1 hypothetical protein QA642_28565 [Bradyrhizobium sp. CB2312]
MILTTHAIVGGAIASLMPSHPVVAFVAGFASHFAIDAIPHWDYPLRSIALGTEGRNRVTMSAARLRDVAVVGLDGFVGFFLTLLIFKTENNTAAIVAGAAGGMLPDPLQFLYTLYPREPLLTLQSFHVNIHTKRRLGRIVGIGSQFAFAAATAVIAIVARDY